MSRSTSPTVSSFRLVVHRIGKSALEHHLEEGRSVFLGSGSSCGIHVEGEGVAEIHCLIDVEEDVVSVQDWASDAGTIVNGLQIEEKTVINVGDSIILGKIQIELSGNSQSVKTPSAEPVAEQIDVADDLPDLETNLSLAESASAELSDDYGRVDAFDDSPSIESEYSDESEVQNEDSIEAPAAIASFDSVTTELDQDFDWDPTEDEDVDPEVVALLRAEIEDLRMQLAERDEQLSLMAQDDDFGVTDSISSTTDADFGDTNLADRVETLLAELEEHDDRVATLQDLLQTAEVQNQAEREERNCLETWVGEIEHRIGQRESELQAEQDALRQRIDDVSEERDKFQQMLHAAKKRVGGPTVEEQLDDETLKELQRRNADLHSQLDEANKQVASLTRQVDRLKQEEPDELQSLRAELAKEKADVSRIRFQLSKQLEDIGNTPVAKDQPDREFAYKLKTLREHLREIHEEEKSERSPKSDSLFGRISNLWKRVDEEY
ncbi:FHA domain-containing protein [Stieleria sp. JC731]|uniref:FHA domain-containing protein n=1 Tax=Pirellulaceae TaxID=2691357 RepID=UPI001E637378|nr:FHA domain-containing protein [Stieleria sp. JC731]MCC9600155.1 FHA domain-containing protein [Stieleria sp. JC731]